MNWKVGILSLSFLFNFLSCQGESESDGLEENPIVQPIYTFAVAGHAYGNPDSYTHSIYPLLLASLDSLIKERQLDQLILTGDVVARDTKTNWENTLRQLDSMAIDEWVIAPGNHDLGDYMKAHVQEEEYMVLERGNSLFMILNTSNPGWTVDSIQATYIEKSLLDAENFDHIFVFSHQLWWQKNPPTKYELDSIRPNSYALFEGESDFWTDAFPYFENLEQDIYFFAGDMGCDILLSGYYEDHYENFHFYGSGMGGGVEDNLIYVQLFQDATVKIDRIDF